MPFRQIPASRSPFRLLMAASGIQKPQVGSTAHRPQVNGNSALINCPRSWQLPVISGVDGRIIDQ
jgi:hypothetical protein